MTTALLTSCTSTPVTEGLVETFDATDRFFKDVAASPTQACESARMALLSQGYSITTDGGLEVRARKDFQSITARQAQVNVYVACTSSRQGRQPRPTTIFVSAVEDRYELKKTSNEASLGVGVLGSISLPYAVSNDSLVKVSSETISSPVFYARFFDVLNRYMPAPDRMPDEHRGSTLDSSLPSR